MLSKIKGFIELQLSPNETFLTEYISLIQKPEILEIVNIQQILTLIESIDIDQRNSWF